MVMKLVDYPLAFRTCVRLRQPEKFCVHQRKHLSGAVPDKQKHGYLRQKINDFILWYDEFTGMDEVRTAQRRVLEDEQNFRKCQEDRRNALMELNEVQRKIKDLNSELDNTSKGDDRYVALVTQEHRLLKEERRVAEKFAMAEKIERDSFSSLSSSVKLSHEKERAQSERTKYWSLIASAVGTVIGILGTSINNHFKVTELKKLIKQSTNKELLDHVTRYLEKSEALLQNLENHPKGLINHHRIEELINNMNDKLSKLEADFNKEHKTGGSNLIAVTHCEDDTVETVTVENLTENMKKEYSQMKALLFTIAFLSILMPLINQFS